MTPLPATSRFARPAAPAPDVVRSLSAIEISVALLAGLGGFALVQWMGLLGAGGA